MTSQEPPRRTVHNGAARLHATSHRRLWPASEIHPYDHSRLTDAGPQSRPGNRVDDPRLPGCRRACIAVLTRRFEDATAIASCAYDIVVDVA